MNLEVELKHARLKPDGILQMIAEKFRFKMGVPEHKFEENKWETEVEMSYKDAKETAICCISLSVYNDVSSYFYEYLGPVVKRDNGGKNILIASYIAHVLQDFVGCFGVPYSGLMIIRDKETPRWFPAENR